MPASIDARPPGLNLAFRRGTTLTLTLQWPTGALAARAFTATLDGVSLGLAIDGTDTTMTITATVAQTAAAAADGGLPFVLTETTGDDQPIIIGTWHASTRPSAVSEQTVQVTEGASTVTVDVSGVNPGPELVVGDPSELDLTVVGDTAVLSILEPIARQTFKHRSGYYYSNTGGVGFQSSGMAAVGRAYYVPAILSVGTIDRIGAEVLTAVASAVLRFAIYLDDDGLPANKLAEPAGTADASTTGTKDITTSLAIPDAGLYWLSIVNQGSATPVAVAGYTSGAHPLMPYSTSPPSGTGGMRALYENNVTGSYPTTATPVADGSSNMGVAPRIHFRYA